MKKLLTILIMSMFFLTLVSAVDISNCTELQDIESGLSGDYVLINDVDCIGVSFNPIGDSESKFTGTFDGQGYTIYNLFIDSTTYVGLFGYGSSCLVSNVNFENASVEASSSYTGVLMGRSDTCDISNSLVSNSLVNSSSSSVGGLVGLHFQGVIYNSSVFNTQVIGTTDVGGFVGFKFHNDIHNSSAIEVDVFGSNNVGGFVGELNENTESIHNCYVTGNVTGENEVGGFVGTINHADIENSYSAVIVSNYGKSSNIGCFVGYRIVGGSVTSSYCDVNVSGVSDVTYGGSANTTLEMYSESTFVGWDFDDIWMIDEGESYPYFQYQEVVEEEETPVEESDYIQGTGAIYETMNTAGAGLGMFMVYMANSIPVLLILVALVSIITLIGYGIAKAIQDSMNQKK